MSCFEKSTFIRNHKVLDQTILIQACEKLGWKYKVVGQELVVNSLGNTSNLRGEPALRLRGNQVSWNSYYMKDGRTQATKLENEYLILYDELQVEYALKAVLNEFKNRGFSYLKDLHFTPNEEEKHRFIMKSRSKSKNETEPEARIKFTILKDGTIQTDSNYIPEDVHKLADEAMETLALKMGNDRVIRPKEIPAKYKNKAFCKNSNVIKLRQNKK